MKAYGEPEVRLQSRLTLAPEAGTRAGCHSGSLIARAEGDAHCVGDWPGLGTGVWAVPELQLYNFRNQTQIILSPRTYPIRSTH
jgi:hypothetical protein